MTIHQYTKGKTILKVDNVSLTLGDKLILRDINLHIEDIIRPDCKQGQVVSLLAPSGIGKSQLLKIISGLQKPNTGSVLIGEDQQPVVSGDVGLVQQTYDLFKRRTVLQNLNIGAKQQIKDPKEREAKVKEYLDYFNLYDKKDLFPVQLSGGQKQRVAIIQQLLSSKHFILLDEPTSGLDPIMINKLSDILIKVSNLDELNTLIMVTHDISTACAISDTVLLMGKDKDPNDSSIFLPGATIKEQIDLIEMNLAWQPDIRQLPEFTKLTADIRKKFEYLA